MDHVGLDIACPQPAGEPKAVAASLIGDDDALDCTAGLIGFGAPPIQQLEQRPLVGIELLQRLTFDARDYRPDEPLRLAHLDYGDQRAILLQSGEGPARVKILRHGALHRLV